MSFAAGAALAYDRAMALRPLWFRRDGCSSAPRAAAHQRGARSSDSYMFRFVSLRGKLVIAAALPQRRGGQEWGGGVLRPAVGEDARGAGAAV